MWLVILCTIVALLLSNAVQEADTYCTELDETYIVCYGTESAVED